MRKSDNTPPEQSLGRGDPAISDEREIDFILADSFPASDPPPWTLGVPAGPERPGAPDAKPQPGPGHSRD